jgi:hypothetical protein
MRYSLVVICVVLIAGCARSARQPFDIHDGYVRYTNLAGTRYRVAGADPATFRHIGGLFGRDARHVFYANELVQGADPDSFAAVSDEVGRDAQSVYFRTRPCESCDLASFRRLDGDWYADKKTAYHAFTPVPGIDTGSFKRFNFWFAKDASSVFISGRRIPGADASSFELQSCGSCEVCGQDKNRCYWFGHPVPCDCKRHSGSEFAGPITEIPPGSALLVDMGPFMLDAKTLPRTSLGLSAGYLRVQPGRHTLGLSCENKRGAAQRKLTVDFEPAGLYRIKHRPGTACDFDVERPAMVQGRVDGPEIRIVAAADKRPRSQIELAPGAHDLTAVCRDVTRTGVRQSSADLKVNLQAGRIYRLDASFMPPEDKCDVRITPMRP